MGLVDDINGEPIKRWTRPLVDSILGEEAAAELDVVLADPLVSPYAIWRALRKRGIKVSQSAVQKWSYESRRPL